MKKNDRVKVDFVSESSTEFSGNHFTGEGAVDRIEDGRVFGRLDDGTPFMCDLSDVCLMPKIQDECDHDWEDISKTGDQQRQLICTYCSSTKSEPFELNKEHWDCE